MDRDTSQAPEIEALEALLSCLHDEQEAVTSLDVAGIELAAYGEQLRQALQLSDFAVALTKAATFGAAVGVVGCALGLRVKGGSEGVGRATTNAVVLGIFMVIVIDAIFVACQRVVG